MGVAAGGALAACGGGDEEPAAAEASVTPRKGGKLRAAFIGGSAESTDPTLAAKVGIDYVRARLVWDTLGELDGGKAVWRLAESVEPNADATKWTVRVREGVTFSDGRQLTAKDVLFSLRALMEKRSPQGGFITHLDLKNARAKDARTVELPLTMADGFFDLALAHSMFVFPDGTKDLIKAVGSGPYTLKTWQAGRSGILVPRADYWDGDNGGPYLDELELVSVTDAAARLSGLKSGQFGYAGAAGRLVEFARHQPALRAFGRTAEDHELLDAALLEQRAQARAAVRIGIPGIAGFALAVQLRFTAVLLLGTVLAIDGSVPAGVLIAVLVLAVRFVEPMGAAAELGGALRMARGTLERLDQVFAAQPQPAAPASPSENDGYGIELDAVRFGYDDGDGPDTLRAARKAVSDASQETGKETPNKTCKDRYMLMSPRRACGA